MSKHRLEGFSDGVLAIIITIMVSELKVPHGTGIANIKPLLPVFLSYVLSFIYVTIYWNNHHHLLHSATHVTGRIMWANLHQLFWLSLFPFTTAWVGENHVAPLPVAVYGFVLFMGAVAWHFLQQTIIKEHGRSSLLAKAIGKDTKGKLSLLLYLSAIPLAFVSPWIAISVYVLVAFMWLIPDRRIEQVLAKAEGH